MPPRPSNRAIGRSNATIKTLGGVAGFAFFIAALLVRNWLDAPDWTITAIFVVSLLVVYWVNRSELVDRLLYNAEQADRNAARDRVVREARLRAKLDARRAATDEARETKRAARAAKRSPRETK